MDIKTILEPSTVQESRPRTNSLNSLRQKKGHAPKARPSKKGHASKGGWGSIQDQIKFGSQPDVYEGEDDFSAEETLDDIEGVDVPFDAKDIEDTFRPLVIEFPDHGETSDIFTMIQRVDASKEYHTLVELIIDVALDSDMGARELYSQLLPKLQMEMGIPQSSFEIAFNRLIKRTEDLMLDVPDAIDAIAKFIARCVADDCLPPKFVSSHRLLQEVSRSRNASLREASASPEGEEEEERPVVVRTPKHYVLRKAHKLLTMHHAMPRLDQVWGVRGRTLPVSALRKRITLMLDEYLSAHDLAEAERCLKDLEAPHYHHELVYQVICRVMEFGQDQELADSFEKLLEYLSTANEISQDQMVGGVKRVYTDLAELEVDLPPKAYDYLRDLLDELCANGCLPEDTRGEMPPPSRRRRFFSENDAALRK